MYLNILKSKIHRATVTDADLNYVGSVTIDAGLMREANIREGEKVDVVNINNGARFATYVLTGKEGSGIICLNGAAARLVQPGDLVIIMAYALMTPEEAEAFKPEVLLVNGDNKVVKKLEGEEPGYVGD